MLEQQYYDEAASVIRDRKKPHEMLRSSEYLAGLISGVAWVLADRPRDKADDCPYEPGIAECDAWLAGWDRGKEIGHEVVQEKQAGRVLLDEETLNSFATMQMSTLVFNLATHGGMDYALEDQYDHMRWREANVLSFLASEVPDASEVDIVATLTALYIAYDQAIDEHFDNLRPQYGQVETWTNKTETISLDIPLELVSNFSELGLAACELEVETLHEVIEPQISRVRYSSILDTLIESGKWSHAELDEDGMEDVNVDRLLWLAGWTLKQERA